MNPFPTLLAIDEDSSALLIFLIYTLAVFGLAAVSNVLMKKKSFLSEYFLGSRSLGVWAFALTFAATSASGGSFTGFPSRIYSHGWILALWIASYMVFPMCTMGLLGKRINQVARISKAITVPDVLRDRFRAPSIGLLAVSLIVFFMSFNLVAQFKAGSKILIVLLRNNDFFREAVFSTKGLLTSTGLNGDGAFLAGVDPAYFLCLVVFAVAVIAYTTYGGFHAVVWTDVMQGVVMVIGVMIMLPLAISQVGGVDEMATKLKEMQPPRVGFMTITTDIEVDEPKPITTRWVVLEDEQGEGTRLFRLNTPFAWPVKTPKSVVTEKGIAQTFKFVEILTPAEVERQLARLKSEKELAEFRDELQPILAKAEATATNELNATTLAALTPHESWKLDIEIAVERDYINGAGQEGVYVTGPGPVGPSLKATAEEENKKAIDDLGDSIGFLPFSIAISYFFMWAISGTGQPSNMVRLMAFNNSVTLRKSIFTVTIYFSMIYFPLVIIFCCARILLPGMELDPDSIMPSMAIELTSNAGVPWLAGLLVAAPFAAIMSTVDSFLLLISSAVVRDIYQRNINPDAKEKTIKRMSYLCTLLVGVGAMLGAVNPPQFLQDIIVYTGSGLSACFLAPVSFALFWPRMNKQGMLGGMLAGFGAHFAMYLAGIPVNGSFFSPWQPMGFDPIIVGLFVSFAATYLVTILTPPPPKDLVRLYFLRKKTTGGETPSTG